MERALEPAPEGTGEPMGDNGGETGNGYGMEPGPCSPGGGCWENLPCLSAGGGSPRPALEPQEHKEPLSEDDLYCRCLSRTLCHTGTPVTVGLFAPCSHRLCSLLDKVTGFMRQDTAALSTSDRLRGCPGPRSPKGWGLLQALWYLSFYRAVVTERHLRRRALAFIFIRFSAWHFTGADRLWAGLVAALCHRIRAHFGALPLSVFHVLGSRPRFASGFSQREWELKRGTCLRLWALLAALGAGAAALAVAALVPGVKESPALKVLGGGAASLSGSGLVLAAASIAKHLVVSEKRRIERLSDSDRFASQLGFMSKVRAEVRALVDFVAFMEVFERRRLRVVLEITGLEQCYPEKVAGVLNAVNTLLSDADAPFIFLLAVDPSVIVPCLEQTGCLKGLADNGYLFLNRTVSLPFSIPAMGARSRLQCLDEAIETREDLLYRAIARSVERRCAKHRATDHHHHHHDGGGDDDGDAAVRRIHEAFHCLRDGADPLARYLPGCGTNVRRVVNTIPITLRLLLHRGAAVAPRAAAAWVVLADRWPCRLSWALQCAEDAWQSPEEPGGFGSRSLWSIFEEHASELGTLRPALHNALSLDADPELFQSFLQRDFPFTAWDARVLLAVTVNLDHSIRHKMGLLRGLNRLQAPAPAPAPVRVNRSVQCPHPE